MGGILRSEIDLRRPMSIRPLNDHALWLDMELRKFFLVGGVGIVIVAGIDTDLNLRVETRVDFRRWIEAVVWR